MRRLHNYDGEPLTPLAIEMVLRTAVRTSELRFATRGEVEGDLWRIPRERMKENLEHLVPLAPGALRVLERAAAFANGSPLLFPGERGKPMSENTMLYALYRAGLKSRATIHGLRGTFSTAANNPDCSIRIGLRCSLHTSSSRVSGLPTTRRATLRSAGR